MKEIILSGVFGWDITPDSVRQQLIEAKGGDIEVVVASTGGSVFDGNDIDNQFSDYKRKNPNAQMSLRMSGIVASQGAQVAMNPSFDLVSTEDNTAFMIHNAWSMSIGDHNKLRKDADMLEGLSSFMTKRVAAKIGGSEAEAQKLMDDETWYFGQQIVDAGFADGIVERPEGSNDQNAISASAEMKKIQAEISKKMYAQKAFKAAASLPESATGSYSDSIEIVEQAWDKSAADKRWRAHVGAEDAPNARYKQAFLWWDAENAENFTAYKLQVKDFVGGREVVNIRAVNNADARLNQTSGPTSEEKTRIQNILNKYQARWQRQQENSSMEIEEAKQEAVAAEKERVKALMDLKAKYAETPSNEMVAKIVDAAVLSGDNIDAVNRDIVLAVSNGNTQAALESPEATPQADAGSISGELEIKKEKTDYSVW